MAAIAQDTSHIAPRELKLINKIGFGAGDIGQGIVATLTGLFLNAFLLDVVGLRPGLVAIIFAISQLWDGVTDPLVGVLSDRTKTRWGYKRPWLLFGAIPFALTYLMLWFVPDLPQTGQFLYFLVMALLMKTAFTAVSVPYTALTPELTKDYDQRTQLNFFRFGFSLLGGLTSVILHPIFVSMGDTVAVGYFISAAVWAFFIILSTWTAFGLTYEMPRVEEKPKTSYEKSGNDLVLIWQNKPFLMVTGIYLLSWLTLQFIQNNLLLYMRYWVNAEEVFTQIFLGLQVTAIIFLGVWAWVSSKIGKKKTYYVGAGIWIAALIALFFIQPGQVMPLFIIAVFGGMGVSIAFLIPWSMIPDVIEYGELETGKRREGIYYGVFIFLQKLGLSLGLLISNTILDTIGYVNPQDLEVATQPANVQLALRLFVSLIPATALALSIPLVMMYPITKEKFVEIQAKLAERKRGESELEDVQE